MYDVMLDYPIVFPKEGSLQDIEWTDGMKYQLGDYIGNYYEEDSGLKGCIFWPIEPPVRQFYTGLNTKYKDDLKKWNEEDMLNKFYVPTTDKIIRNFSSWDRAGKAIFKQMSKEDCSDIENRVWRHLGNGRFKQIGIQFPDSNDGYNFHDEYFNGLCKKHYLNRLKSSFIAKRFKDSDTTTMNIYVGESVNDLLKNFTLDIPKEQFVFPYPHGVSFVRKDYTTYLYENEDDIIWSYFGKNGTFRMNVIKYQDIINNGRISSKTISKFYKQLVKNLTADVSGFMDSYFESNFGIKTENIPNNHLSLGVIRSLCSSVYGIETLEHDNAINGLKTDMTSNYPKIDDCFNLIHEDLLKIICLNDREFANKKLKKKSEGKAIVSKINPKRIGRRYFKWGEDDIVYVYPTNSRSGAKLRRHIRRGHTKKQPIKYPKNYGGKAFQMDGAWYVSKTIDPYWAGGGSSIPENQISPFCFGAIKMKYAGGSRIASQWIKRIENELGRKLTHNENGGKEYRINYNDGKWFYIDAWDEETNTVYEFHGDYFHGNPTIFNAEEVNKTINKTYGELYEATMQKKEILEEMGYNYICIWESDFINI